MPEPLHTAMVLAAGLGTRMRPLTDHVPKPLVEVGGRPLIEYTLALLEQAGVGRIVVNASYRAEQMRDYFARRLTGEVMLSYEEERLETGGGIAHALPLLGDVAFYALNSDVILCNGSTQPALARMAAAWEPQRMDGLLLVVPKEKATGYEGAGDFFLEEGVLRRRGEAASAPYVFTGTQILHPRLFAGCPRGAFSLNLIYDGQRDAQGRLPNFGALVHDGAWLHVGDPKGKEVAEGMLERVCA